ncbi:MAG TPA: CDGSH iron-sulfur domain-containing protein [Planctomycetota bacterium]|nr:CDGSH iron-sulfur domain-containing protein [Planctomycetota bacterium]
MPDPVPNAVSVTAKPNGPYLIAGDFVLMDSTGAKVVLVPGKIVALCRCGQSSMKPFCDGSHSRTGFKAADPAPAR